LGFDAYVENAQFRDGIVKVIGPYSSHRAVSPRLNELIYSLTVLLERGTSGTVVWGTVARGDEERAIGRNAVFAGEPMVWLPNISLRSEAALAHGDLDDFRREWSWEHGLTRITHKVGFEFEYSDSCFDADYSRMLTDASVRVSRSAVCSSDVLDSSHELAVQALAQIGLKVLSRVMNVETTPKLVAVR
jgi:hypothetical protein